MVHSYRAVLERFYTSAGNPIKEILLKLNLPDHRILKDGSEVEPSKTGYINSEEADDTDEEVESKKEVKEETKGEPEKEEEDDPEHFDTFPTMKELRYHKWLLKNPRPAWVKAKIRTENVNNVKFSCMIGQFNKEQAYLDLESPINVIFNEKKLGSSEEVSLYNS
ncbi:hypothetical protein Tco_1164566 [Tanacetum coccineum]